MPLFIFRNRNTVCLKNIINNWIFLSSLQDWQLRKHWNELCPFWRITRVTTLCSSRSLYNYGFDFVNVVVLADVDGTKSEWLQDLSKTLNKFHAKLPRTKLETLATLFSELWARHFHVSHWWFLSEETPLRLLQSNHPPKLRPQHLSRWWTGHSNRSSSRSALRVKWHKHCSNECTMKLRSFMDWCAVLLQILDFLSSPTGAFFSSARFRRIQSHHALDSLTEVIICHTTDAQLIFVNDVVSLQEC